MAKAKGRVTVPTDMDVVKETLEIMDKWGADAIRDCDGTEFPQELKDAGAKVYATYYTTRKDNEWAKANPDEIQQMYIMTKFCTAVSDTLEIHLMDNLYPDMLKVNDRDDITRWWEVIDLPLFLLFLLSFFLCLQYKCPRIQIQARSRFLSQVSVFLRLIKVPIGSHQIPDS